MTDHEALPATVAPTYCGVKYAVAPVTRVMRYSLPSGAVNSAPVHDCNGVMPVKVAKRVGVVMATVCDAVPLTGA